MTTVNVNASKSYDIHIGSNLLPSIGTYAKELGKIESACIVSDSTVFPLYGDTVRSSLEQAGFTVTSFVFPAGEESKNSTTYFSLLCELAENRFTRSDLIVALGGGVVGDLAGFAAATYLRGIRFIQVPTTLLSAVDSSVGGKTAIDLPSGKNLAGAFFQPSLVLCDIGTLSTLPEEIFCDGCAEVIKYAMIYDQHLFSLLEQDGLNFDRETVITKCVELKRDVVALDEFDTGARMKLNLGHTVGHAVEAASHLTISHGKAVAIGMAMITRSSAAAGSISQTECARLQALLEQFHLPINTVYPVSQLIPAMLSDKKRQGGTVNLIIPNEIGNCSILPVPMDKLPDLVQAGL